MSYSLSGARIAAKKRSDAVKIHLPPGAAMAN